METAIVLLVISTLWFISSARWWKREAEGLQRELSHMAALQTTARNECAKVEADYAKRDAERDQKLREIVARVHELRTSKLP